MSYDSDFDDDFFEPDADQFYHGFVSPADDWKVSRETLFGELNGSFFHATAKFNKRLARLNDVIAFSDSKDTRHVSKKNRLSDNYNFLTQFIPDATFDKITEILSFSVKDKKNIARDIGLNLDTLSNIISLWQLELYTTGNYVSESVLDEINVFLKESSSFGSMKKRGHITSKDLERAESRILKQLYSQLIDNVSSSPDQAIPSRVLPYYQEFILSLDQYLNDNQKALKEKSSSLPFHVYLLVQKLEIFKHLLPKIALDYFKMFIEPVDLSNLCFILDQFYLDKSALVGEVIAQGIILLEAYYLKKAVFDKIPTKFYTRIKKYRRELKPIFQDIVNNLNLEYSSCIDSNEIKDNSISPEFKDIKQRIDNLTLFNNHDSSDEDGSSSEKSAV